MTAETVLRRIERHCREERPVYENYQPPAEMRGNRNGAKGEARGVVYALDEIQTLCRTIRKQMKKGHYS
jgi:hypothetical protein